MEAWLDQVARELAPLDAPRALVLIERFIEADADWFECADDSDAAIGDAVRAACRHWLATAAGCGGTPEAWAERLRQLVEADAYGARDELLRCAHLLLDAPALRLLAARYQAQLEQALASAPPDEPGPPVEVLRCSGALSLLAQALRDPEVHVQAVLRYRPQPNEIQREEFARAYLAAGRPAEALGWLQGDWGRLEGSRQRLLAEALGAAGRTGEHAAILGRLFEQTRSAHDLTRWLEALPERERPEARERARGLALAHGEPAAAAEVLLALDDACAAESVLLAAAERLDGRAWGGLTGLAEALRARGLARGETAVLRALLLGILERAYARAYGHAARYWWRLEEIAGSTASLSPLASHAEFEAQVRARHGRKTAFWARVRQEHDLSGQHDRPDR